MLAAHHLPLFLPCARETLGVFQEKGDRDHIGTVLMAVVAFQVHRFLEAAVCGGRMIRSEQ